MTNYPLSWPSGWRRAKPHERKIAHFKHQRDRLSVYDGVTRVLEQLRLFGYWDSEHIIISTNVKPRLDGLPRGDSAQPVDPGVAVY